MRGEMIYTRCYGCGKLDDCTDVSTYGLLCPACERAVSVFSSESGSRLTAARETLDYFQIRTSSYNNNPEIERRYFDAALDGIGQGWHSVLSGSPYSHETPESGSVLQSAATAAQNRGEIGY